jgi:hypothetical protein
VLEAARANGIDIPYFCWHPELSDRRQLPRSARAGRGTKLGRDRLQHAGVRGLARAHRFGCGAQYRKSILQL